MKTSKAIDEIKAAGHDISDEYSRAECIGFLNTAIHEVSGLLIAANSPMMVREILIHDGEALCAFGGAVPNAHHRTDSTVH